MSVNIRPIGGDVLLQVFDLSERLLGGVVVRGRAMRESFRRAVVRRLPSGYSGGLEEGCEVLIPPYAGREVLLNKERLVFVKEKDIEAVLEE